MIDVQCPRCRQFSLTLWDKMTTGPAGTIECPKCRSKLIVPVSGLWTSIPALAAGVLALWYVEPAWADVLLIACGAAVSGWLNYKFVKLI